MGIPIGNKKIGKEKETNSVVWYETFVRLYHEKYKLIKKLENIPPSYATNLGWSPQTKKYQKIDSQ